MTRRDFSERDIHMALDGELQPFASEHEVSDVLAMAKPKAMPEQILHLGQYSEDLETLTSLLKQPKFLAQFAERWNGMSLIYGK